VALRLRPHYSSRVIVRKIIFQHEIVQCSGTSTVLLNNHYFKDRAGVARYEYGVDISTSPYMNLVCDVAGDQETYSPCHGVLLLNVPGFDSTIMNERTALSWTDVVGQAGAYFALVQLVSWMISGLAWNI